MEALTRCRLEQMVGREVPCTEAGCAFWEPGGAVLEGGCAFDRLDRSFGPEVARLLLEIRAALENAGTPQQRVALQRELRHLLGD